ncbi:MAG: AsnC family transcriptional regulator [Ectothiorhodospiraceae bacterium]|nr:AsnC family transcriptional regulator [Ectothiorhodospiraceae bacterium]
MDALDRALVNRLQDGIPVAERPFQATAQELGITEQAVVDRIQRMVDAGVLSRFGPLYNAERLGGEVTLAAMAVPEERFEDVAALVNGYPEVAHNYAREHKLNMWFVVSTEQPGRIRVVLDDIRRRSGLPVYDMPREREFYIGLRFKL